MSFTTEMLKQISLKSIDNNSLNKIYKETITYLENIGFIKTPFISFTDKDVIYRCFMFQSGQEKVLFEFRKDNHEELLQLVFSPMEITFVHDILLMRFNQAARESGKMFIYTQSHNFS